MVSVIRRKQLAQKLKERTRVFSLDTIHRVLSSIQEKNFLDIWTDLVCDRPITIVDAEKMLGYIAKLDKYLAKKQAVEVVS